MELRATKHTEKYDDYIVTIVGYYTQEEQQVLFAKNQWQTSAVRFTASLGFWRDSKRFTGVKYYEFCHPGIRIEGFSNGGADSFIQHDVPGIAGIINQQLAKLIRAHQTEQRDAFFHGGFESGPVIDMSPIPPGSVTPAVPPAPRGLPPIGKFSLDGVPTKNHSRINLADFVREKIDPTPPRDIPEVEHLFWRFGEFENEDDHTVRLYAAMSPDERTRVKDQGLYHHSFGEVQLFDADALERLETAQAQEIVSTADPHIRASLRIEHQAQLKTAREAKDDLTLLDFFAYPYCKTFANRYQATQGQRKLNSTMLEIKKMLEGGRDR